MIAESHPSASQDFTEAADIRYSPYMAAQLYEFLSFPIMLFDLAISALGFSTDAFMRAASSGPAQTAALTIAFLAGVSEMLGQSVVLVLNRVALYRFLASLLFTGATYVGAVVAWGLSAFAIAPLTRVGDLGLSDISSVVGIIALSFAPRLFGVFSIAPYFGLALSNALEAWTMVLVIFGLHTALGLPVPAALVCGGAGWVLSYVLRGYLGRLMGRPLGKLQRRIAGSPLDQSPKQIIDDLIHHFSREKRN